MKTKFSINRLSILSLLILAMGASCTQAPAEQDVKTDIEKVNLAIMDAINKQDVDQLMAHYTNDVILLPSNNETVSGKEAVKQMWVDGFNYGMGHLKFITNEATAIGNMAQEHGTYKYYTPDNEMVDHGKYIVIWKMEGEQWKIAKDIWNSTMPMPPRATMKDTIALAITKVKQKNVEDLTNFATNIFLPAFNKHFPESKATSRIFTVLKEKGDAELIYLIDPVVQGHVHDVKTVLSKHYSEEEVEQHMKDFKSYVIKQEIVYAVPMKW